MSISNFIKSIKNYSTNEIIGSFINCFIKSHNIDLLRIDNYQNSEINKYIHYSSSELENNINANFRQLTIKDLEIMFENIIDNERKKKEGVVYTPEYIIDFILDYSINIFNKNNNTNFIPVICDPACGSGGFLLKALNKLSKLYNISLNEALNYIRGVDINPHSISYTKILLEIFFISQTKTLPKNNYNLFVMDTLLTDTSEYLKKIKTPNGIDILVTNPPYVKFQHLEEKYRTQLINKYSQYIHGNFSTSILFILKGYNLLSNNGVLGYITQNNFFTSLTAKKIREYLQEKQALHTIIDFGHTKVFEHASAYTFLLFLTKSPNNKFYFEWCLSPKKNLKNISLKSQISINILNSKKWRLAPKKHLKNLYKIENIGKKLKEITDIKVGIATLKDTVYIISDEINIEPEIVKPIIKISEWNNEMEMKKNKKKIIFPYKKINNKFVVIDEEEMKNNYPKAYSYLLKHKEKLLSRNKGKLKIKYFYEWGRNQSMEANGPKLLTKTFSKGPNFMLDITDSLFCNGYSIKPKNENQLPIKVLQKILNSMIMDYYTKITSFQIEGNYQCFQKNFIETFAIPELTDLDIEFILNNNNIDEFLCQLYDIKIEEIKEIITR